MCTNPISIVRQYRSLGIKRSFVVPCGKCAECLKKKRSELAALSVMQANVSGSVFFITLTYRNEMLPVAHTSVDSGERKVFAYSRGYVGKAENFKNAVFLDSAGVSSCYSLCREDVKKWLKQCRREWQRLHKEKLDFSYLICGEYGEERGRPHYHGLIYGVSRVQVDFMAALWEKRFGFSLVRPQTGSISVTDAAKVSNYVSKYMNKGVYSAWLHILPYVEKPRRQSSILFGLTDNETIEQISDFIRGAIFSQIVYKDLGSLDARILISCAVSLIDKKLSLLMASRMPFPGALKKR